MPELPKPITENKFPDCIAMNLHLKTDSQSGQFFSFLKRLNTSPTRSNPQELDVSLSVNFSSEQQIEVPGGEYLGFRGGKVTFGVRQGKLQIDLKNCQLPLNLIALDSSFKISMAIETPPEQDQEHSNGSSTGSEIEAELIGHTTEAPSSVNQTPVDTSAWILTFQAKGNGPLSGSAMTETKLGRLQLTDLPCDIKATFKVRGEDIRLTWSKVGPSQNLARNKIAMIERALALRYIKPQLESGSLSEVSWQYG